MRISDWSSDVCSSDLRDRGRAHLAVIGDQVAIADVMRVARPARHVLAPGDGEQQPLRVGPGVRHRADEGGLEPGDRKSVVWGTSVSVRVDLGGTRILKQKIP